MRTVAEATEAFDLITYEKGGAVLRMLEGYLGRETFRDGIRRYMRRHARGNAVAADLWRALGEASGEPVLELAEAWIDSPGFPLVTAAARRRHAAPHAAALLLPAGRRGRGGPLAGAGGAALRGRRAGARAAAGAARGAPRR